MSDNYQRRRRYDDDGGYIPGSSRHNNQQGYTPSEPNENNRYGRGNTYGSGSPYSQDYTGYDNSYQPPDANSGRYPSSPEDYGDYEPAQRVGDGNARYSRPASNYRGGGVHKERKKTVTSGEGDRYEVYDEYVAPKKEKKKENLSTSRGCLTAAIYTAIVLAVSVLLSFYIIVGMNDMFALKKQDVTVQVEIPKDAQVEQIAEILKENGVIDYPGFFKFFAGFTMDDDENFKHGTYQISTKSDYKQIIRKLTNPSSADKSIIKITFPEGKNILQYAELLEENNVCKKDAFLKTVNELDFNFEFLKGITVGEGSDRIYRLEGYLFPDTYDFYLNEGSKSAITRMLNNFNKKYKEEIQPLVKESGKSLEEILIIASIIERETPDPNEMATVSSVFHNRLKSKSEYPKLQSDATRWYPYATKEDVPADKLSGFSSKYDTTIINGLMPGAICNPGLSAIKAAAQPASTSYYFFYTDKNGKHYYAKTYAEHQANVKYCQDNGLAA